MTGIARGVLFMSLLVSGCATRTPPTIEPHAPPRPPVPADVVDIRGIWRDKDLDAAGARARGLDPALIETPIKLLNVNPTYPPAARQAGIQGDVMAYCVIGVDGVPRDCYVHRSVSPELNSGALAAIAGWRFKPLRLAGKERPALVELRVSYLLR
jgi:TonB family protein